MIKIEDNLGNWGKIFESVFERSLVGAGTAVYAVWSYCIAKAHPPDGIIELNPVVIGAILGEKPEVIAAAIAKLCSPDAASHTEGSDGARLEQVRPFTYRMVNWELYRGAKTPAQVRAYNRKKKAEERARKHAKKSIRV